MTYRAVKTLTMAFLLLSVVIQSASGEDTAKSEQSCGKMTIRDAAEILGVSSEAVKYSYSNEMKTCSYRVSFDKRINYSLYLANDEPSAQSEMATVTEGLKMLVSCRPVENVGDSAIYCSGDRAERFLVQKDKMWVDIRSPKGLDVMIRVSKKILQ